MEESVEKKFARIRKVLNLERPDRLPMGDTGGVEYRPDVYHLGSAEYAVEAGEVGVSKDGKKKFTRDGGVWAVGDPEIYKDHEDVLNVAPETLEVEEVGPAMLDKMASLYEARSKTTFPVPWQYGTLVTRATIMFGWEPFLIASALEPKKFGKILDRFGEASLAVVSGWAETDGVELIIVHDDIAATRGPILKPQWCREYAFPWYRRIFDAIHERGSKVLFVSDGNYLPILDDILETGTDGLYVESKSMDPKEFLTRAGKDKLYLIKSNTLIIDFGTPEDVYREVKLLSELHQDYPGMMMYRGGSAKKENVEAFSRYYQEMLVYE